MNFTGNGPHTSIRTRLLAIALLPLLGVLPLLGALLLWWGNQAFDRVLVTKVRSDLAVARGYFDRVLGEVDTSVVAVAESHALQGALAAPAAAREPVLERFRHRARLDFLQLLPPDAAEPEGASVEVLDGAAIGALAPSLASRVEVRLVPTQNAVPTEREVEDRAMVLRATHVVRDAAGQVLARVQGGVLLNRNLAFIDHVNEIVYPEGSLPFGSRGTATLFLDDVRISTNVRLFGAAGDERAIGTRVSRQVRQAVLGQGETWLDRAFVVSDWYVSAYQPVLDGSGRRVGMLYVGFLERPFTWLKLGALAAIGAIFVAAMALAAVFSLRWARQIFTPLERMEATMRRFQGGEAAARVGVVASGDEIGRLAGHLDRLLDVVDANTRQLERWNAELDAKVAERTRELEATQQQLVRSERLATVGQLTASIAHEVNNPIAVIQGNLDLMRELLGSDGTQRVAGELKLVDQQIERMRLIVTKLLQFARPTEYAGYLETLAPARVVDDCLVLVGHLLAKTRIVVRRDDQATRRVSINRQELQQVLVNLLVNAIDAMGDGGTLTLATRDVEGDGVAIEVADTGPGLDPALFAQLFQPFVTRKKDGTGLGLWVSRGIVERYGGEILAANREPGPGARFTVRLKADAGSSTADCAAP